MSRDISYKYGSIHTLGRVLYPVASDSVQIFLDSNPFLSEFASWYRKYARLPKNDMVTVFAPTNAAFERIAPSIRKNLAKNEVLKARKCSVESDGREPSRSSFVFFSPQLILFSPLQALFSNTSLRDYGFLRRCQQVEQCSRPWTA